MGMGRGGLMIMPMLVPMLVLVLVLVPVLRITVFVMFHRLFDP
jgi:hypothetical protein